MSKPVSGAPPWWRRQVSYWQILAIAVAVTFMLSFVTLKPLTKEAVSRWLLRGAAVGIGLCAGEAIRRRFE